MPTKPKPVTLASLDAKLDALIALVQGGVMVKEVKLLPRPAKNPKRGGR